MLRTKHEKSPSIIRLELYICHLDVYKGLLEIIRAAGGRLELEIPSLGYWSGLSWMRLRIGAVQLGECYTLVSLAGDAERETGAEQLYRLTVKALQVTGQLRETPMETPSCPRAAA